MSGHVWSADIDIDAALVLRLVNDQFHELCVETIEPFDVLDGGGFSQRFSCAFPSCDGDDRHRCILVWMRSGNVSTSSRIVSARSRRASACSGCPSTHSDRAFLSALVSTVGA
jgi:hypothetical protein